MIPTQPTHRNALESMIKQASRSKLAREALALSVVFTLSGDALAQNYPQQARRAPASQARHQLQDLVLKEYDSLNAALQDYETVLQHADTAVRNANAILGRTTKTPPAERISIEPYRIDDNHTGFRTIMRLDAESAAPYQSVMSAFGQDSTKQIPAERKEKNLALNPNLKEGHYIQMSAMRDGKMSVDAKMALRKLGFDVTVYYDSEKDLVKTFVGPYSDAEMKDATIAAKKMLSDYSILQLLDDNELGIVHVTKTKEGYAFKWHEVVTEKTKLMDVNDPKAKALVKTRVERANRVAASMKLQIYTDDQIDSLALRLVREHNYQNPGNKVNFDDIRAVIMTESSYNPRLESNKGAIGLMQLLLPTAREQYGKNLTKEELFRPEVNLFCGIKYYAWLQQLPEVKSIKNPVDRKKAVFAAYNGGLNAIKPSRSASGLMVYQNTGNRGYRETRGYVNKVMQFSTQLKGRMINQ
jgi:hypothetical protein